VSKGRYEPISYDLLREASQLNRRNYQRSALIIAVAALEVGAKECVARIVPDAAWLVNEAPMPPVTSILKAFLPQMFDSMSIPKTYTIPKKTLTHIETIVKARNTFVHTFPRRERYEKAVAETTFLKVEETVNVVRDVLLLLDIYAGNFKAYERLTSTMVQLLNEQNGNKPLPPLVRPQDPGRPGLSGERRAGDRDR